MPDIRQNCQLIAVRFQVQSDIAYTSISVEEGDSIPSPLKALAGDDFGDVP